MSHDLSAPSIEELLAESAWVRGLAHSLVFDQSQVDDVVQQTWMVALQRAVPLRRHPRAWLAGIVRNVVRRQVRTGQRRRRLLERLEAPADPVSTAEVAEQAELFGVVVEAALALREPFRMVILLRFFKGWEPRQIAEHLDVPSATVRTRLHRALELLRGHLDARAGGDRRQWSLGLLPLVAGGQLGTVTSAASAAGPLAGALSLTAKPVSIGVLGMTMKTVVGVGAFVLVGVAGWWLGSGTAETPAPVLQDPAIVIAPGHGDPLSGPLDSSADDELGTLAAHIGSPAPLETSFDATPATPALDAVGVVVYGSIADQQGAPLSASRARVLLSGPGAAKRVCEVSGSAYSFAGLAPGAWSLRLDAEGYLPLAVELELQAGPPRRHDLVLGRSVVLPVRVVTPGGESTQELLDAAAGSAWDSLRLTAVATKAPLTGDLPEITHSSITRHGVGSYRANTHYPWEEADPSVPADCDGVLELSEGLPVWVSLLARHVVVATQEVPVDASEVVFVVSVERVTEVMGAVTLTVVSADSREPLSTAKVSLSDSQSSGFSRAVDEVGQIRFDAVSPGLMELSVQAQGHETRHQVLSVPSGGVADLGELALHPATTLTGRVVDASGQPVAVSFSVLPLERFGRDADLYRRRQWMSVGDGSFTVAPVGRERFTLFAVSQKWASAPQVIDARDGDVSDIVVVVGEPVKVSLRAGWSPEQTRSLDLYTAEGLPLRHIERWSGGSVQTERLLPGDYEVVVAGRSVSQAFTVGAGPTSVDVQ